MSQPTTQCTPRVKSHPELCKKNISNRIKKYPKAKLRQYRAYNDYIRVGFFISKGNPRIGIFIVKNSVSTAHFLFEKRKIPRHHHRIHESYIISLSCIHTATVNNHRTRVCRYANRPQLSFGNSKRLLVRGVYRQSYVVNYITASITHITSVALKQTALRAVCRLNIEE